jgi:hypothetical protein
LIVGRKLVLSLAAAMLAYAVAEGIMTALYLRGDLEPASIWILEETGEGSTIQFDPILGYRLTQSPTRMACIATNGVVESVGFVRGNNRGFPDRDDFAPQRSDAAVKRFAVFGDSFTAAQFLEVNWPDRCEDLARAAGRPVQLLNFSIDGGGHTNWWRTLQEHVASSDYELDGVIFAVYGNDLRRPFVIWDDQVQQRAEDGTRTIAFGTVWNHALPRTLEEAIPFFHGLPRWQIHPTGVLDQMLGGELRPSDNRSGTYIARQLYRSIFDRAAPPRQYTFEDVAAYHYQDPARVDMWTDIRNCLKSRGWPALVVDVPAIDLILRNSGHSVEAQAFALFLRGKFVDGAGAYQGLGQDEIRACWLPYDGHWGQSGSDRFAAFMVDVLAEWPESRGGDVAP